MEGYSNYQQVIDAIKAEYVNARSLKRIATATGRKTKATESFKKRKEVESKSLADKSKSINALLDSKLSEEVDDLNKSKFKDFKTKLSVLEAKLEFIDSESKRFDLLNQIDPVKFKDATQTQEQTFSVVRNLLAAAISDTKLAIDNIYNGENYSEIVKATKPNYLTHSEEEVIEYYNKSQQTYVRLFDKAKEEIDIYNQNLFAHVEGIKQQKNLLIQQSTELVNLKSQLATLLENESPQSDIDSKENEIESLKESMLDNAKDLRILDVERDEWIEGKFSDVSVFIDDLYEFKEEFSEFRQQNDSFLSKRPRADKWINNETSKLYESLFQALENNYMSFNNLNYSISGNNQGNEFSLVWKGLKDSRNEKTQMQSEMDNSYLKLQSLEKDRMFDTVDGQWNGEISDFKKGIQSEYKSFYVDCATELFKVANDYMEQKVARENLKEQIQNYFYISQEERTNHEKYALILSQMKNQQLTIDFDYNKLQNGHYEGNLQQEEAFWNAKDAYFSSESDYEYKKSILQMFGNKYSVYNTLFPNFFDSLAQYQMSVDSASTNKDAAVNSYYDKLATVNTAYDYLQTLTVGEADYVNALAAYEKSSLELQASLEALSLLDVDVDQANSFLQSTLDAEAAYQNDVLEQNVIIAEAQDDISQGQTSIAESQDSRANAQQTKSVAEATEAQAQDTKSVAEATKAQAQSDKAQAQATKSQAQATKAQAQSDKAQYLADGGTDQVIIDDYDSTIANATKAIAETQMIIAEAEATIANATADIAEAEATIANATADIAEATKAIAEAQMIIAQAQAKISQAQNTIANANEALNQAINSHYIYLGAQSDYDSKVATRDAYYTDIVSGNQTQKDDAYNFLQNLTDEDDAYQTALKDWTAESEVLVILSEQKDAASLALDSANNDLVASISFTYGEEFSLSISGQELREAKLELVQGQSDLAEANADRDVRSQALTDAQNEMTFVQATPQQKREAKMIESQRNKVESQFYRWDEINVNHTAYLSQITNRLNNVLSDFLNNPFSIGDTYLLDNIMTFIDGNANDKTYIQSMKNRMSCEYINQNLQAKMEFYKDCVNSFSLNDNFGIFANPQEDILSAIQTNDGSALQNALRETVDYKIQMFPASGFASQIEDEVNNGNPLVN